MSEKIPESKVVIIMGSPSDREYVNEITKTLSDLGVAYHRRIASAHKSTDHLLQMVRQYNQINSKIVFIAVAGLSNALGAVIDTHTYYPVISAPPSSQEYGGVDIWSSLRTPYGIGTLTVLKAETAALAAAKILALNDDNLKRKIRAFQLKQEDNLVKADQLLRIKQAKE